jgi:hypothetical protein
LGIHFGKFIPLEQSTSPIRLQIVPSSDIFLYADSDLDERKHARGGLYSEMSFQLVVGSEKVIQVFSPVLRCHPDTEPTDLWNWIRLISNQGNKTWGHSPLYIDRYPSKIIIQLFVGNKVQRFVTKPRDDLDSISIFNSIIWKCRAHSSLTSELNCVIDVEKHVTNDPKPIANISNSILLFLKRLTER